MKRIDWIYLASLTAYSFLFWKQEPGLNFLIMNIVLVTGLVINDKNVLRNRHWLLCAVAALLTSFCVAYYGNALSVLANFTSLLGVAGFSLHRGNSWFVATGLAWLNAFTAVAFMVLAVIRRITDLSHAGPNRFNLKRVLLLFVVLIIAFLFFAMYRGSSILFESLTNAIDLSFISVPWIVFMIGGGILLFSFYRQQRYAIVSDWDKNLPVSLTPQERKTILDKMMCADSEYFSGMLLFGILNAMLLLVNGLDVAFLTSDGSFLPEDVTYSQYVHQGIDMLILSILFATLLIIYYFRNFHADSKSYKTIRWLALLWVAQNMFMIVTTIFRNHSYIYVFGLTYKRIGVDVYLLLALIGLALVTWKVIRQRSLAFLMRNFGWALFMVLAVACPVNWDKIIFDYNSALLRRLDMSYLNELSSNILVEQHTYRKDGYQLTIYENQQLDRKTFYFLSRQRMMEENSKWPSSVFKSNSVYDELTALDSLLSDSALHIPGCSLETIYYFPAYHNVTGISAYSNELKDLGELDQYTRLESLDLRYNHSLISLNGIEKCKSLRVLDLRDTGIYDFSPLDKVPNLEILYVNYMGADEMTRLQSIHPNLIINTDY